MSSLASNGKICILHIVIMLRFEVFVLLSPMTHIRGLKLKVNEILFSLKIWYLFLPFFYYKGKKVAKCCLSGMQMFSEKAWTRHTHKDTHNFVPLSWNKAQLLWLFAMHRKRLGPSQEKLHSFLISGALLKTH